MGTETLTQLGKCHRDHKFTPHFIVDILRPDRYREAASVTSEDRFEAAHLRLKPLTSGPLSPGSESETRHQAHRSKKMRTTFTGRQIFVMEKMFETKKYLNANERSHLSRSVRCIIVYCYMYVYGKLRKYTLLNIVLVTEKKMNV